MLLTETTRVFVMPIIMQFCVVIGVNPNILWKAMTQKTILLLCRKSIAAKVKMTV